MRAKHFPRIGKTKTKVDTAQRTFKKSNIQMARIFGKTFFISFTYRRQGENAKNSKEMVYGQKILDEDKEKENLKTCKMCHYTSSNVTNFQLSPYFSFLSSSLCFFLQTHKIISIFFITTVLCSCVPCDLTYVTFSKKKNILWFAFREKRMEKVFI